MTGDRPHRGPGEPSAGEAEAGGTARIVEFGSLVDRLRISALALGVLALGGAVVEGVLDGLTFAVLIRWSTMLVVAFLLVAAVLTALHAYAGADRAQQRGERLASDDVGLRPRRQRREER